MNTFLSLAEFRTTRKDCADLGAEFGFGEDGEPATTGFIYADCCYIERREADDSYFLCVQISDWHDSDLAKLEAILWANHYLFEQPDIVLSSEDRGTLDDFIVGICAGFRKPVDGDLWGQVFSGPAPWTPQQAFETIHAHLYPVVAS